jgi:hypothetical protein
MSVFEKLKYIGRYVVTCVAIWHASACFGQIPRDARVAEVDFSANAPSSYSGLLKVSVLDFRKQPIVVSACGDMTLYPFTELLRSLHKAQQDRSLEGYLKCVTSDSVSDVKDVMTGPYSERFFEAWRKISGYEVNLAIFDTSTSCVVVYKILSDKPRFSFCHMRVENGVWLMDSRSPQNKVWLTGLTKALEQFPREPQISFVDKPE